MTDNPSNQESERKTMKPAKAFTINQVLSITTGRLACEMGGVYEILNHITGDNLYTHVLPRACRFAAPFILEQYPELAEAGTEDNLGILDRLITEAIARNQSPMDGVWMWLAMLTDAQVGGLAAEYAIMPHADAWLSLNPLDELKGMVGEEKITVIES